MDFLVFSDSHGRYAMMKHIIDRHKNEIDAVLHLGDGAAEVLALRRLYPDLPIHGVLGNCDGEDYTAFGIHREYMLPAAGKMIFLAHGDRLSIAGGHTYMMEYAKRKGADIALHGHLHIAFEKYYPADEIRPDDRPFWIFSPGSISSPRDGAPSFGLLHVSDAGVCFSVGRI
ncbi:MAG: metallophosphoesterase family protein [Clostridia bacterium]|nr:metallophosphoesterase family protein [Clostridia bacterium]